MIFSEKTVKFILYLKNNIFNLFTKITITLFLQILSTVRLLYTIIFLNIYTMEFLGKKSQNSKALKDLKPFGFTDLY